MSAIILSGIELANKIKADIKKDIKNLKQKPGLAVILVGNDPASETYVNAKEKACKEIGIGFDIHKLPEDMNEGKLISLVEELNMNEKIHGILVQLPLPEHIDEKKVMRAISPEKDVDGLTPVNHGKLLTGDETMAPCTPKGIIKILEDVDLEGKNIVIINHSNIIGKPLAIMLLNRDATVTVCHKKTGNLNKYTKEADILITATGNPGLIKSDMIKDGAVVIDAGIKKVGDRVLGDADFDSVKEKASFITPVPGGVGPMTVVMVLKNTLIAARNQLS